MDSLRAWTRDHTLAVDAVVAGAFFALGLLAIRLAYDVGLTLPHRFSFAAGVACMAYSPFPWRFAAVTPRSA